MADSIVSNFISTQINLREILSRELSKARALSFVALKSDFDECPGDILHDYFWALTDILTEILGQNEQYLKELIKTAREQHFGEEGEGNL